MPAPVGLLELVSVERTDAPKQLELVAEVRPHHLGAVGRDREAHVAAAERADGVSQRVLVRKRARQEIRARADLEDDSPLAQELERVVVLRGEDPVPDPVGAEVLDDLDDLGDAALAALLALNRERAAAAKA